MTTKHLIKKVETCEKCKGAGMVQHPAWAEYWREHPVEFNTTVTEDRAWFEAHGWNDGMTTQTNGLPDEEIVCGECEGAGEIESETELEAAMAELSMLGNELLFAFSAASKGVDACRMNLHGKAETVIAARESLERARNKAMLENKFDGKNAETREAQAREHFHVAYNELSAFEEDERRAKLEFDLALSALELAKYRLRIAELTK